MKFAKIEIDAREDRAKVVIDGHELNPEYISRTYSLSAGSDEITAVTLTDVAVEGAQQTTLKDGVLLVAPLTD